MKALILNSGLGRRMGNLTSNIPKCLVKISATETILSRQLKLIAAAGIDEIIITTGYCEQVLIDYCNSLSYPIKITYVNNPLYTETNYIYSIYCARDYLDDDILLMHGDIVFESAVLDELLECKMSCMKVSSTSKISNKDFKVAICSGKIVKIGTDLFENVVEAQALYKLNRTDWTKWLENIANFCQKGNIQCYAEDAFNEIYDQCKIYAIDVKDKICMEIDNDDDLKIVKEKIAEVERRTVYMCFSTDIIHSGHINIIKKAAKLGKLIIGVLADQAIMSYKRYPLLSFEERVVMFQNIVGVYKVVEQKKLSYQENIEKYKPTYVVHGDDWKRGIQKSIRDEVITILNTYGGKLIEYPYADEEKFRILELQAKQRLASPDVRRGRLKREIEIKGLITAMEAHSGITGILVENTTVEEGGGKRQFDAMWISSLCDSTTKGKPDIELVDMTSRLKTIDDICEVTTKPIIFDGDTGGIIEHFVYTVRTLERMGVSMVVIEDKTGLKRNSLFGNEVSQIQDSIDNFCLKIKAGKQAQRTKDFMICARIESLILEKGIEDALKRADAYVNAGVDAILIHSRKKEPDEIFEFIKKFRIKNAETPIAVVPTTYNMVHEETFKNLGVNIVIYANYFTRTSFPAMQNAAKLILKNHRAKECDDICMSIKDILTLIPVE